MEISKHIILFNLIFNFGLVYPCGIKSARIMNGELAPDNNWPWIVSLQKYNDATKTSREHFCGGTLILPQYIITAAHCLVDKKDYSLFVAKLGSNYAVEPGKAENLYEIAEVYNHNNYDNTNANNDISILKLKNKVALSQNISTICLPGTNDVDLIIGKDVDVAGWGSSDGFQTTQSFKNELLQARLKIYNSKPICQNDLTYHYCAFDETAKKSSVCSGDSGGPLIYLNQGKWYLFGITSYSFDNKTGACDVFRESYFTKVPVYINWIEQYTGSISSTTTSRPNNSNFIAYFSSKILIILSLFANIISRIY